MKIVSALDLVREDTKSGIKLHDDAECLSYQYHCGNTNNCKNYILELTKV